MARETLKDYLGGTADHVNYKVNVTGGEPGVVGGVAVGDEGLGKEPNTGIEIIGYGEDKSISSGYLHHITKNKNFYEFSEKPGDKAAHSGDRGNYLPQPEDFIKDDPYVILG